MKVRVLKHKEKIKYIQIEVTTRCNAGCTICEHSFLENKHADIDLGIYANILNGFPDAKYLLLQGTGEPLLNNKLEELIVIAKKYNLTVTTITNGSLLTEKRINSLNKSKIDEISISFNTLDKKLYNQIRPNLALDDLINNINNAKHHKNIFKLSFTTILMKKNFHELKSIIDFAMISNIEEIQLLNLYPVGRGVAVKNNCVDYSNISIVNELYYLAEYARDKGVKLKLPVMSLQDSSIIAKNCIWKREAVYYNVYGKSAPCCMNIQDIKNNNNNSLQYWFTCDDCINNLFVLRNYVDKK